MYVRVDTVRTCNQTIWAWAAAPNLQANPCVWREGGTRIEYVTTIVLYVGSVPIFRFRATKNNNNNNNGDTCTTMLPLSLPTCTSRPTTYVVRDGGTCIYLRFIAEQ